MLLAIDAGNTRIKWGLHNGQSWLYRNHLAYENISELTMYVHQASHIIVSNVAGPAVAKAITQVLHGRAVHTLQAADYQCGVSNHYQLADQLGSDRWAALIAAHHHGAGTALVVTAGTALTVDALHVGEFLGGVIVPGYQLMRTALVQHTAQLKVTTGLFSNLPINTADAITSGCQLALAGTVERMAHTLQQHTGSMIQVWLSGGDAPILMPHLSLPVHLEDNLVLDGLRLIAQEVYA